MAPRENLDTALLGINEKVMEMGQLVEQAIREATRSIKEKDQAMARAIIDGDEVIDDMEDEIRKECFRFLATQAPVAGDLRYAISTMGAVRDLERIGDHCEDLAKYTLRLENAEYYKELVDIPRMANMSANMVVNAIKAFVEKDLRLARKVWKADEEVDELFQYLFEEQLKIATEDPNKAEVAVPFAFIAAHLERIADYATNICEETVFCLQGEYEMEEES